MGLERFNSSMSRDTTPIRIGYPAFQIVSNPTNRKLYIFNRLSTEHGGYYVYNLEGDSIEAFIETPNPIGDLIYNPLLNQVVIAEFSANQQANEGLRVYNGSTNAFEQTYTYEGNGYLGRLFLAPNNKLYISANTKCDDKAPKVLICDANDYSLIDSVSVGITENKGVAFCLKTHYCYNPYNGMVYVVFNNNFSYQTPYQTAYHSTFRITDPLESPNPPQNSSKFFAINEEDNTVSIPVQLSNPGEILCAVPDTVKEKENYKGIIYIAGASLYLYDCSSGSLTTVNSISKTVDMEYSPQTNCLYVYEHNIIPVDNHLDTNRINIYKVNEDGTYAQLWEQDGFANSITYNKYDGQLYVYYDADFQMLGQNASKIYMIDASVDSNAIPTHVNLYNKSLSPQIFPQVNTPYFDPYGKAYFPTGMHSCLSVLDYTANESYVLQPGLSWISFPRLYRSSNNAVETIPLLETIYPEPDTMSLTGLPNQSFDEIYQTLYKDGIWDGELDYVQSSEGYKLDLPGDDIRHLFMKGTVLDPTWTDTLYADYENWTGYWLYQEQDIFEALGDVVDSLYLIKHQNWTCIRGIAPWTNPIQVDPNDNWFCDQRERNIKFGEMVVLKGKRSDFAFQWQNSFTTPGDENGTQNPEYYSYTEQADYTPMLIELDNADQPIEIAAFVNDSCVGATVVFENDTVVAMRAYLQGNIGDSVTFEKYYGTKSVPSGKIKKYQVWDPEIDINEQKAIRLGEGRDRYFVSFKNQNKEQEEITNKTMCEIWPNPATTVLHCSFELSQERTVVMQLQDITGKVTMNYPDELFPEGTHHLQLPLRNQQGNKLKPGLYLLWIKYGDYIETKKLIVK